MLEKFLLKERKKTKKIAFDLETFAYNKQEKKPTKRKNETFSCNISFFYDGECYSKNYVNIIGFYDEVREINKKSKAKTKPRIQLYSLNGNKYDNWFCLADTIRHNKLVKRHNAILTEKGFKTNEDLTDFTVIEKHVKAKTNLEFIYEEYGQTYEYIDMLPKLQLSLYKTAERLINNNLMDPKYLKTDFNYEKYDSLADMTDGQAMAKARKINKNLTKEEMIYINNDTIILAHAIEYYSVMFPFAKLTDISLSSAVFRLYTKDNPMSLFQMRLLYKDNKYTEHIELTRYYIGNETVYDFCKSFYRGGMNLCNFKYVGCVLHNLFCIDINSSYPNVLYGKIPTYLTDYEERQKPIKIKVDLDNNKFYMYRISYKEANKLLSYVNSDIIKQMFVKRLTVNEYVNITNVDIMNILRFTNLKSYTLSILSMLEFAYEDYGAKGIIEDRYKIKTFCGAKTDMDFSNGLKDIREIPGSNNPTAFTPLDKDNAKIILNAPYGLPGLRPYFPSFEVLEDGNYIKDPAGLHNSERNIVFSLYTTSQAFYNLLEPLVRVPVELIDEYFVYCDTDSLYLKLEALQYISEDEFCHPHNIGKWSFDARHIKNMLVVNHKKYVYEYEKGIKVKAGGLNKKSIDRIIKEEKTFENLRKHYFNGNGKIDATRSVLTDQGKIHIYNGSTDIKYLKCDYPTEFNMLNLIARDILKHKVALEDLDLEDVTPEDDSLYIETLVGDITQSEIEYTPFEVTMGTLSIDDLLKDYNQAREYLDSVL